VPAEGFTVAEAAGFVEAAGLASATGLVDGFSVAAGVADTLADGMVDGVLVVADGSTVTAAEELGAEDTAGLPSVQAANAAVITNASTMKPIFFICDVSPFTHL
jgi:hypothetical protein